MPQDVNLQTDDNSTSEQDKQSALSPQQRPGPWLQTPQPVKRVFDRFPLITYDSNHLPHQRAGRKHNHALYIFTTASDSERGRPSYNPGCLKWQAYLHFQGINFVTIPSNNHASPTGALPFLLPAVTPSVSTAAAVPSNRLQRWASQVRTPKRKMEKSYPNSDGKVAGDEEENKGERTDIRYEAYMSLLDYRIRNAYLYALYLCSSNFASIVRPLYIDSTSTNPLVRLALSYQLRKAAHAELLKYASTIDVGALYRESEKAFGALSQLLDGNRYFFGEEKPGLFDAAVFAYTNILLDDGIIWKKRRMSEDLARLENLVRHRERILRIYFPSKS